jgi:hypothetical protein
MILAELFSPASWNATPIWIRVDVAALTRDTLKRRNDARAVKNSRKYDTIADSHREQSQDIGDPEGAL